MDNKSSKATHSNLLSVRILKVTFNTTTIWINLIHYKTFKVIKTLQRDPNHIKTYIGYFSHYCDKILDKKATLGRKVLVWIMVLGNTVHWSREVMVADSPRQNRN